MIHEAWILQVVMQIMCDAFPKSVENELKFAGMVTFPTSISSQGEKLQMRISFASNLRKQFLYYFVFYK